MCVCGAEGAGWDITVGSKGVGVGSGCGGGGTCAVHWRVVEMGGGGVCSLFSLRPQQSAAMQMVVIMWAGGGGAPHTGSLLCALPKTSAPLTGSPPLPAARPRHLEPISSDLLSNQYPR